MRAWETKKKKKKKKKLKVFIFHKIRPFYGVLGCVRVQFLKKLGRPGQKTRGNLDFDHLSSPPPFLNPSPNIRKKKKKKIHQKKKKKKKKIVCVATQ